MDRDKGAKVKSRIILAVLNTVAGLGGGLYTVVMHARGFDTLDITLGIISIMLFTFAATANWMLAFPPWRPTPLANECRRQHLDDVALHWPTPPQDSRY